MSDWGGSRFVNRRYVRAKNWHFKNDSYKAVKKLMKMIPLQCILGLNFGPFLSIFRTRKQKFSEILTLQCILSFSTPLSTLTVHLEDAKKPTLSARTYRHSFCLGAPPRACTLLDFLLHFKLVLTDAMSAPPTALYFYLNQFI